MTTALTQPDTERNKRKTRADQMATGFIPPWQDMPTLCLCICVVPNTVDKWVMEGVLPAPRMRGGKQMWKWSEVDEYLTSGGARSPDAEAERIRDASRNADTRNAGH